MLISESQHISNMLQQYNALRYVGDSKRLAPNGEPIHDIVYQMHDGSFLTLDVYGIHVSPAMS